MPEHSPEPRSLEPLPLRRGQRIAAGTVGTVLAAAGAASVFVGPNQAGSVALLLAGGVFLLITVSGMPLLGAKAKDFELHLAWQWRRTVADVAAGLPNDEAVRLIEIVDGNDPGAYAEPLLTLVDRLLLEARVRDAVITAVEGGERVEAHPDAGNGEPLLIWVAGPEETRVGVFAMFAPTETGRMSASVRDEFVRRLPQAGCDAHLWVTCVPELAALTALATRVRDELGQPVAVELLEAGGGVPPLRAAVDRLCGEVTG